MPCIATAAAYHNSSSTQALCLQLYNTVKTLCSQVIDLVLAICLAGLPVPEQWLGMQRPSRAVSLHACRAFGSQL